jgi:hypothetical protein
MLVMLTFKFNFRNNSITSLFRRGNVVTDFQVILLLTRNMHRSSAGSTTVVIEQKTSSSSSSSNNNISTEVNRVDVTENVNINTNINNNNISTEVNRVDVTENVNINTNINNDESQIPDRLSSLKEKIIKNRETFKTDSSTFFEKKEANLHQSSPLSNEQVNINIDRSEDPKVNEANIKNLFPKRTDNTSASSNSNSEESTSSNSNSEESTSSNNNIEESASASSNVEEANISQNIPTNDFLTQQVLKLKTVTSIFIESSTTYLAKLGITREESQRATLAYSGLLKRCEAFLASFSRPGKIAFLFACSSAIATIGYIIFKFGKPNWLNVLSNGGQVLFNVFNKTSSATTGTGTQQPTTINIYSGSTPNTTNLPSSPVAQGNINMPSPEGFQDFLKDYPLVSLLFGGAIVAYRRISIPISVGVAIAPYITKFFTRK